MKPLLIVLAFLGGAVISQSQPSDRIADPNAPEKNRDLVSREQRDLLGLREKTWPGVVEPEVYTKLDELDATVVRLKKEARSKDEAFAALFGMQFKGTVYVQVRLKPDAKIKNVFSHLKASEFHAWHLFPSDAGFVGFANKEALDKMAKNPDVAGVGLDDKAVSPGQVKIVLKDELPPPKDDDTSDEQPGVKDGKVEPEVYRAFDVVDRAFVWVMLRGDDLPAVDETLETNERLNQAEKRLRDRVLETMTADEFCMRAGEGGGASFLGFITRDGLQKLLKHPDVFQVRLNSKKN